MAITGYTFDRAKVTSGSDSSLYNFLSGSRDGVIPNRGNGLNVSTNGLTCTIDTGQALIQGRLVEVTAQESVTIPANSTGYLCITIDLSQINTSTGTPGQSDYAFVLGQLKTEFVETLTNQDLLNGGTIYNFNLGSVTSTSTSVTYTKNWNAYTPSFIFPYGAVFGDSINDYGSAILENRWYADTDNLYIEPQANKRAIVRQVGTTSTYLPVQASGFVGSNVVYLESDSAAGQVVVRQSGTTTTFLPIKARNFVAPNDTTGWINFSLESSFINNTLEPYANTAAYRCTGNIVLIKAGITAPSSVTYTSGNSYPIFTIPSAHRPSYKVSTTVNGILSDLTDPVTAVFYFVIDSTSGICYLRPTRTISGKNIYINIHINYLLLP